MHLAAGKRGFEHVACIHGALGCACPHERVQLVDEEDDAPLVLDDLVDHLLEPLLELAAVLRPGDHAGQVELDDAAVRQGFRDLVVDDALGDAFDDRRLADAWIADQSRVVLRSPREDLDRLLDLVRATGGRARTDRGSGSCSSRACRPRPRRRG